jgi:hypothetical protein
MDNIFVFSSVISVVFLLLKFIEMRFIDKENKPLKFLIRDTLVVFVSVVSGHYVLEQIQPMNVVSSPAVFTDNPGF